MLFRPTTSVAVAAVALLALGCRKEEVRVVEVPKDLPAAGAGKEDASPHGKMGGAASTADAKRVPWTVPDGWAEKPSTGGMRLATYSVAAPDGRSVDISVVALGPQAGSELDNVNRWRQQLKLEPVDLAGLATLGSPVKLGSQSTMLYDLVGKEKTIEEKYVARTLAVIWPAGSMTVFFKASGEAALVGENKEKFIAWINSVKSDPDSGETSSAPAAPSAKPAPSSAPAAAPSAGALPMASSASGELPAWQVPAGWKAAGQKPMRLASFEIPNAGGAAGDVSISALGSGGGGLLANVNRWRGQVGLGPTDDATLAKETTALKLAGGKAGTLVDLPGAQERILGAIVPDGERTWFFKLKGESALVGKERENFVKFVESVKL